MPEYTKRQRQFLQKWLRGTTCADHVRTIHWVSPCGNYLVLKHHGHSEYMGRFSGTVWCPTSYSLYCIDDKVDALGRPQLWYREGHWKTEYLEDVKKEVAWHGRIYGSKSRGGDDRK